MLTKVQITSLVTFVIFTVFGYFGYLTYGIGFSSVYLQSDTLQTELQTRCNKGSSHLNGKIMNNLHSLRIIPTGSLSSFHFLIFLWSFFVLGFIGAANFSPAVRNSANIFLFILLLSTIATIQTQ